jgi:hypothetical protein
VKNPRYGCIQSAGNLLDEFNGLNRRQGVRAYPAGCRHIFHHDIANVSLLAKVIDRQNMGMVELGNGLRFADKTLGETGFVAK